MDVRSVTRRYGNKTYYFLTAEDSDKNVYLQQEIPKQESDRIRSNTYTINGESALGSQFLSNVSGKYYVNIGRYDSGKGTYTPVLPDSSYNTINGYVQNDTGLKRALITSQNTSITDPNSQSSPTGGSTPAPTDPNTPLSSQEVSIFYPEKLSTDQDCIKFTVYKLKKTNVTEQSAGTALVESLKRYKNKQSDDSLYERVEPYTSIILPIQASITDQNTVNWGAGELNELQRILAQASATSMTSQGNPIDAFGKGFQTIIDQVKGGNAAFKQIIYNALLEQAVQAPGLLARTTGSILNPNIELLFQGPQLRPFNFTFKLSPRNETEADRVRSIIKAFKKNMAPVFEDGSILLKSPNVFKIEYFHKDEIHQSINLIKMCALQSCSVDYTPLGTYMTYDDAQDSKASMVSYTVNLVFNEINPIYSSDYDNTHSIGY